MPERRRSVAAVGLEVVLITGSILLAFGLDAWWDRWGDRASEQTLLVALQTEFDGIEEELARARDVHERRQKAATELIGVIDNNRQFPPADSLWSLVQSAIVRTTIDPPSGVLSSSIGSGAIALIQDAELGQALTAWPDRVSDHAKTEDNARSYVGQFMLPWMASQAIYPPLDGADERWRDRVSTSLRSQQFRAHLWYLRAQSTTIIDESEALSASVDRVLTLLSRSVH